MNLRLISFAAISVLLCGTAAFSQDTGSGLDFLNISPTPALLGIAEAQAATPAGAGSIYANPALLATEDASSLDVHYTLWISGVENQFGAVNLRRNNRAIAFGFYSSRTETFQGSFAAETISYISIAGAYSHSIGPFSAGLSAHYLREEVFEHRANGVALNAGVSSRFIEEKVRLGIALLNIGRMEDLNQEATSLPSTLRSGFELRLIRFRTPGLDDLPILVSLHGEWMKPLREHPSSDFTGDDQGASFFNLGVSAEITELFTLRSGFRFGPTERPFSFGAGISIDPVVVHYALIPFSTGYDTVHSIGLQYYF